MYHEITNEDAYKTPMRIYPAVHYTMGGLWVDYNLMSNVPGLFVLGEANFSDHGANRLGASALMQGLSGSSFSGHHQRLSRVAKYDGRRSITSRSGRPRKTSKIAEIAW
jgi:succinate dehydrogenase / fumarate reductase flavoprotein subunit